MLPPSSRSSHSPRAHRSKREVEVLIAGLAPRPAVPTVLRKVAVASQAFTAITLGHAPTPCSRAIDAAATAAVVDETNANSPDAHAADRPDLPLAQRPLTRRATVAPLSAEIYKLQVTISATTRDKLRRALDLQIGRAHV